VHLVRTSQENSAQTLEIQIWPIDRLVLYARNPRKNDAAVERMCASIREFGFKIPVLARSDGEVVDGHLRLKAVIVNSPCAVITAVRTSIALVGKTSKRILQTMAMEWR
jgi:hypothetical protein